MSFSRTLQNTVGVGLEREAYRQFGFAVEEFSRGVLGGILGQQPVPPDVTRAPQYDLRNTGIWEPTRYAAAIASAGDLTPRFKFLFKVHFEFDPAIRDWLSEISQKPIEQIERNLIFTVKSVDKPKFEFDYEEVNMYNFRTKVLKSIKHREINLVFLDDVRNNVIDFFNMYRKALQPSARMSNAYQIHNSLDDYGFTFSDKMGLVNTAKRTALPNNAINVFKKITVYQFYSIPNAEGGNPQFDIKSNKFVFVNPRISMFDLDDLNHEGSELNIATMQFDFDTLYMESNISLMNDPDSGRFPEHPKGDILFTVGENQNRRDGKGAEISRTGKRNPFVDILARQGQRAVQETVSNFLNRRLGNVAGGALGGAFAQISGALGNATRRTLGNVSLGVNNGIAIPTTVPVIDNSNPPSTIIANPPRRVSSNDLKDIYL